MTLFLREKRGKLYKVYREAGHEKWILLKETELNNINISKKIKKKLVKQTVKMSCSNPSCSNSIITTKEQKQDFLISFKKKYDKFALPCCSKDCQDKVLNLLKDV